MQQLIDLYNRYFSAKWYTSYALWVGMFAGALPYLADWGQVLLDNLGLFSDALALTPTQKARIQLVLVLVVLPLARAIKQKGITDANRAQDIALIAKELATSPSSAASDVAGIVNAMWANAQTKPPAEPEPVTKQEG